MTSITSILDKSTVTKSDLIELLKCEGADMELLFAKAAKVKQEFIGNGVALRGLIELSNSCSKDCYYCGIRKSNNETKRYFLSEEDVLEAAQFAHNQGIGSLAIQSGEICSDFFTEKISSIIKGVKKISNNQLGITLSCGEQSRETYKQWFDLGAHRYLLRIESSNAELYNKIHPMDENHNHQHRLNCLKDLKSLGFQTGTGVMIGLPFQTYEDLAGDLLFMKEFDIDMCGMGPYLEHSETPLYDYRNHLLSLEKRYELSLKMIAILRILMKDINIASTTALQAIKPEGRMKAIEVGANILMPNISPGKSREDYSLYMNKPGTKDTPEDGLLKLSKGLESINHRMLINEWGDSKHFLKKKQ